MDKDELRANILEYADLYTDELFEVFYKKFRGVKSRYARLFFDAERFEDDSKEEMQKFGLGWFYEVAILEKKTLGSTKNKEKIKFHFSNKSYWFFKKSNFPDISIGFDEFHKNKKLIEIIKKEFSEYKISENYPYSGSIVPFDYYQKEKNVKFVMIKISKRIYLEDDNITKNKDFKKIKEKLANIANFISQFLI